MADAKVSALVTVRNGERFLADALRSIMGQSRLADEVILVDGASSDATLAIAARFPDLRVIQQPGTGLADARNAAIVAARGPYIAFLDHDDLWAPDKLATQLPLLARRAGLAYSTARLEMFAESGSRSSPRQAANGAEVPRAGPTPGTLMAPKTLFEKIGGFSDRYRIGCDLEWFARARRLGVAVVTVDAVLLRKRLHSGNLSQDVATNRGETFDIVRESLKWRRR